MKSVLFDISDPDDILELATFLTSAVYTDVVNIVVGEEGKTFLLIDDFGSTTSSVYVIQGEINDIAVKEFDYITVKIKPLLDSVKLANTRFRLSYAEEDTKVSLWVDNVKLHIPLEEGCDEVEIEEISSMLNTATNKIATPNPDLYKPLFGTNTGGEMYNIMSIKPDGVSYGSMKHLCDVSYNTGVPKLITVPSVFLRRLQSMSTFSTKTSKDYFVGLGENSVVITSGKIAFIACDASMQLPLVKEAIGSQATLASIKFDDKSLSDMYSSIVKLNVALYNTQQKFISLSYNNPHLVLAVTNSSNLTSNTVITVDDDAECADITLNVLIKTLAVIFGKETSGVELEIKETAMLIKHGAVTHYVSIHL